MKHLNMLTKSLSCNEIWTKQLPPESAYAQQSTNNDAAAAAANGADAALVASKRHKSSDKLAKAKTENHKTVIYFGDSISSKKQHNQLQQQMRAQQRSMHQLNGGDHKDEPSDLKHAQRLCDEMVFKRQQSGRNPNEVHSKCATDEMVTIVNDVKVITNENNANMNIVKHLKSVIEEKCQANGDKSMSNDTKKDKSEEKCIANESNGKFNDELNASKIEVGKQLPSFVESVVNGVINIKIDDSYMAATKLVRSIESADTEDTDSFDAMDDGNDLFLDVGGEVNNMYLDWSFVQDWRSR